MTTVNDHDPHIICCFEDVQHHLEEMGISSWIRSGQLVFVHPDGYDFILERDYHDWLAYKVNNENMVIFGGPVGVQLQSYLRSICEFLESILSYYLDALHKVENAK